MAELPSPPGFPAPPSAPVGGPTPPPDFRSIHAPFVKPEPEPPAAAPLVVPVMPVPSPAAPRPEIGAEGLVVPTGASAASMASSFAGMEEQASAQFDLSRMVTPAKLRRSSSAEETPDPEDVPFDVWAAGVVDWNAGGFVAVVHRKRPATYIIDGRQHITGGRLGEIHECPTEALIETLYGGGEGHCEIIGPGANGQPKFYGQRSWKNAAEPKPSSRGVDVNEARGSSMAGAEQVFTKVVDVLARQTERAQDKAEAASGGGGVYNANVLDLARDAGKAQASVEAAQAVTEVKFTRERLEALERENAALRAQAGNGHGNLGEIFSGVKELMAVREPQRADARDRDRDADYYATAMRDMRERHDREVELMRKTHEERINALRDDNRRALDQLREDNRQTLERERDMARARIDDIETRHRTELDRVRETERYAQAQAVGAKDARIETLQHELERVRDDGRKDREREIEEKREWKDRALRAEEKLTELRGQVTKLEVELAHRPTEAKGLVGQMKEIAATRKAMQDFMGIDDARGAGDGGDTGTVGSIFSGLKDLLDHPVADAVVKRVADKMTGQAEIDRKKEERLAALNVLREKERNNAQLKGMLLRNKQLELAKELGLRPGGSTAAADPQAAAASSPPSQPAASPTSPYWEAGDPPLPDSPTKREVSPAVEGFKTLLLSAEEFIVNAWPAERFVDEMKKQMPLEVVRDTLLAQFQTHSVFLQELADEGADRAFPAMYHPAGRRWLKDLWAQIQKRVGPPGQDAINKARGGDDDEDGDEEADNGE